MKLCAKLETKHNKKNSADNCNSSIQKYVLETD